MPPIPGNICTYTSVQQKRGCFSLHPLSVFTPLQRLTNHYYKQMHTIRIGTSDGPGARGSSVILELVTVKTIVSVAQHYLGKLVERVVYT